MSAEILQKLEEISRKLDRPPSVKDRLRVTRCTQTEFDKLPAMVSRQEFMDWTGYSASELMEEVNAGRIKVYKPKGHKKARYYKHEIGRLGGWKM
jgi:hypothetical protein